MLVIIMGVSGCGKTTVGEALAEFLGWEFVDADDFHPQANKAKMRQGIALQDEDRAEWLGRLADLLRARTCAGRSLVMACSALRQAYRDQLAAAQTFRLVYLVGTRELIAQRLATRAGHFMNPALLDSQFATLEPPEDAVRIPVELPVSEAVGQILKALNLKAD